MTKKFITHCFIRKNTPELKAKLEKVGILLNPLTKNHNEEIGLVAYDGTYFTIREENILDNVINCGENEALFLALAAMNDSDDKDQWFTDGINWILCKYSSWIDSVVRSKHNDYGYTDTLDKYRKATVPEIIEHFKTKEK